MITNDSSGWGFPYNYDIWQVTSIADAIVHAGSQKEVVISSPVNMPGATQESIEHAESNDYWASSYTRPGLNNSEPFSVITIPIFDALDSVKLDMTKEHPFVGIVTFSLYWRELIQNILEGLDKVVVVVEDACAPSFTYLLDGPNAIYLGKGDLHDPKFDGMEHRAPLASMLEGAYTGLPLSKHYCPKYISVYPSEAMSSMYNTDDPVVFTFTAAAIFVFATFVFLMYTFWVNRRQRIVMERALASGSIVSSLYPREIRQKLYQEENRKLKLAKQKTTNTFSVANSVTVSMK